MPENNIELELRAEVSLERFDSLLQELTAVAKPTSISKRLSVMFLGEIQKSSFDIRARINRGGKAEIVTKKGDFHTHDRIEASQAITKDQFIGMIKLLSLFTFKSKVTERENFLFNLGNDVSLVLVRAGTIAYVEIEKMSNSETMESNKKELLDLIASYYLKLIKDGTAFNELCDRLTEFSDWPFNATPADFERLEKMLTDY